MADISTVREIFNYVKRAYTAIQAIRQRVESFENCSPRVAAVIAIILSVESSLDSISKLGNNLPAAFAEHNSKLVLSLANELEAAKVFIEKIKPRYSMSKSVWKRPMKLMRFMWSAADDLSKLTTRQQQICELCSVLHTAVAMHTAASGLRANAVPNAEEKVFNDFWASEFGSATEVDTSTFLQRCEVKFGRAPSLPSDWKLVPENEARKLSSFFAWVSKQATLGRPVGSQYDVEQPEPSAEEEFLAIPQPLLEVLPENVASTAHLEVSQTTRNTIQACLRFLGKAHELADMYSSKHAALVAFRWRSQDAMKQRDEFISRINPLESTLSTVQNKIKDGSSTIEKLNVAVDVMLLLQKRSPTELADGTSDEVVQMREMVKNLLQKVDLDLSSPSAIKVQLEEALATLRDETAALEELRKNVDAISGVVLAMKQKRDSMAVLLEKRKADQCVLEQDLHNLSLQIQLTVQNSNQVITSLAVRTNDDELIEESAALVGCITEKLLKLSM